MTAVSTWHHHPDPDRGKRRPKVYQVRVPYTGEQAEFERTARRLGHTDIGRFFVQAARVWIYLLTEAAFRQEQADIDREREQLRERADKAERERQERRERGEDPRW